MNITLLVLVFVLLATNIVTFIYSYRATKDAKHSASLIRVHANRAHISEHTKEVCSDLNQFLFLLLLDLVTEVNESKKRYKIMAIKECLRDLAAKENVYDMHEYVEKILNNIDKVDEIMYILQYIVDDHSCNRLLRKETKEKFDENWNNAEEYAKEMYYSEEAYEESIERVKEAGGSEEEDNITPFEELAYMFKRFTSKIHHAVNRHAPPAMEEYDY